MPVSFGLRPMLSGSEVVAVKAERPHGTEQRSGDFSLHFVQEDECAIS
jgi:hypothetical protein